MNIAECATMSVTSLDLKELFEKLSISSEQFEYVWDIIITCDTPLGVWVGTIYGVVK